MKSTDGKLWYVTGDGVQVVDPRHLADNKVPPPVHIEQIVADNKTYWQNLAGAPVPKPHLPPRIRDLQIDYSALSLAAPEKVHFKYKLEGQDNDWREVINDREVQYSNLRPGPYRFRVIATNNSGVWNEQGDTLEFSIAPAYYQTNWFRALCVLVFFALLWAAYQFRRPAIASSIRHDSGGASWRAHTDCPRIARYAVTKIPRPFATVSSCDLQVARRRDRVPRNPRSHGRASVSGNHGGPECRAGSAAVHGGEK